MSARPRPPDDVYFPVVPMLDMAFQLLAFFVLTFQPPSAETRIDLDLPAAPAALPRAAERSSGAPELVGLETDLVVEAEADDEGRLRALRLAGTPLASAEALAERLRRYVGVLEGHPVRVTITADASLLYDDAARLIGACTSAGVATVRLAARGDHESARTSR
jgi:biopolymer transport protein ExbD